MNTITEEMIYNFYSSDESIEEGVVDALKGLLDKIRKAILALIDKIEDLLDNAKDSKFKSILKTGLSKAKSLLSRTNSCNSKEDAQDIAKEAKQIKEEVQGISEEFKKAVEDKNKTRVRIIIKDSMLLDKSFYSAGNMINYAITHGIDNLWDDEDDELYDLTDKSRWTEDYMNEVFVDFVNNFSKKKFEFLKKIIRYLYSDDKSGKFEPEKFEPETFKPETFEPEKFESDPKKKKKND